MREYVKPKMKFVALCNEEAVAEKCWGNHSDKTQRYYDTLGKGYVGFYIDGSSCDLSGLVVIYYDQKNDKVGETLVADDSRYQAMLKKLTEASSGSEAQSFSGEKQFPNNPGGMS